MTGVLMLCIFASLMFTFVFDAVFLFSHRTTFMGSLFLYPLLLKLEHLLLVLLPLLRIHTSVQKCMNIMCVVHCVL